MHLLCFWGFVASLGRILPSLKSFNEIITRPVVGAGNWNINDSHIKKAFKCQYHNLMLRILIISLHDIYT